MTRTRTRAHIRVVSILAVGALLVAGGGVAQADETVADGDGLVPVVDNNMAFGTIPCSVMQSKAAPVAVKRNGSATGTNTFKDGTTVTITVVSVTGAGLGLAATIGTPNTITLQTTWSTIGNNTMSDAVASTVTLTSTTPGPGSGSVSYSATGLNSDNHYITRPGAMAVTWTTGTCNTTPTNTTPTVSVDGVTTEGSYPKGSVPAATCSVTDTEDGPSSFPATLSDITGPYLADGIGSQTASCTYTDHGGLTASASVTYSIIDPTAPSISYILASAAPAGPAGWYTTDVSLTWTVTESESPSSLIKTGCDNQTITADQAAATYSCSATSAGGSAGPPVKVTIMRDATAPVVTGSVTSTAIDVNGTTWYKDRADVAWSATDATSGVMADSLTPTSATLGEGWNQSADADAYDNAGNRGTGYVVGINVDSLAPSVGITCPGDVIKGSTANARWTASDEANGSGLVGDSSGSVALDTSSVGSKTAIAPTASDNVGHTSDAATCSYSVVFDFAGFFRPIDMGEVYNVAKAGSAIPVKFTLGGDQGLNIFAAGYPKVTTVACSTGAPVDAIEEFAFATASGLKYDSLAGQYNYTWKTASTFAGSCRMLTVKFIDGTSHTALFKFTK